MNFENMCNNWFVFPMIMCLAMIFFCIIMFNKRGFRGPWMRNYYESGDKSVRSDSAIDIIKSRYAKGDISKEEYDQMKKDLLD